MCDQTTRLKYLSSAIEDLSSCIRFMDTKVAAVIAADMLMLTLLPSFIGYYTKFTGNCYMKAFLWIAIIIFSLSTIFVYKNGISTLLARIGKTKGNIETTDTKASHERTSWFVSEDSKSYPIEKYLSDFEEKNDDALINEMAKELYKLNQINLIKMRKANGVLKAFACSLISAVFILGLLFIGNTSADSSKSHISNSMTLEEKTSPLEEIQVISANISVDMLGSKDI